MDTKKLVPGRSRRRLLTFPVAAGVAFSAFVAPLAVASPARADDGDLRVGRARLSEDGRTVQVRVRYECEEGRTAGVGIFLTQEIDNGSLAQAGAGSGQRPCTGETETVRLTVSAGKVAFERGTATINVSLYVSGTVPSCGSAQLEDEVYLAQR